jgi:hypothetical protein
MERRSVLAGLITVPVVWATAPLAVARADTPPKPTQRVILTITGAISRTNAPGAAEFDRPTLESFEQVSFTTTTPWYTGTTTFEGVRLSLLMEAVGAKGVNATVVALNDYSADIPFADFTAHAPILAIKRNGQYMAVREKGPLFIVYPFDADRSLHSERFYSRSVWQVKQIIVK